MVDTGLSPIFNGTEPVADIHQQKIVQAIIKQAFIQSVVLGA
jgi:hypothetical protein